MLLARERDDEFKFVDHAVGPAEVILIFARRSRKRQCKG
jgi:hypothetical protein